MATPRSTDSGEAARQSALEQITFRFCAECSNMLYPKEDEESHKLQYTCRTCQYTEEAATSCVFRDVMNNAAGETAGVTQDVGSDPTVGASKSSSVKLSSCPIHRTGISQAVTPPQSHGGDNAPESDNASEGDTGDTPKDTDDLDVALCFRCGCPLLTCSVCGDPAPVRQYNNFCYAVVDGGQLANAKEDNWREVAEHFSHLTDEGQEAWADNFTSGPFRFITFEGGRQTSLSDLLCGDFPDEDLEPDGMEMLPRSKQNCPACNHDEAVFFQSQQRSADTGMKLFYVCCDCGNIFQTN